MLSKICLCVWKSIRMTRTKDSSDLFYAFTGSDITEEQAQRAAATVKRHSTSEKEVNLLLAMLGLEVTQASALP